MKTYYERGNMVAELEESRRNQHTAGKWRVGDAGRTVFGPNLGNPSPETIAPCMVKANAARIVECVNAHDALVAERDELRAVLAKTIQRTEQLCSTVNTLSNKLGLGDKVRSEDYTDIARAAIAKAAP